MDLSIGVLSLAITLFLAWTGFLIGAVRYLLDKYQAGLETRLRYLEERIGVLADWRYSVEKNILETKVEMAQEYVKREDWVRFGVTIDSKIDRLAQGMEQMREAINGRIQS